MANATLGEILLSAFTEDSRQNNSAEDFEEFNHIIGTFVQVRAVKMAPIPDEEDRNGAGFSGGYEHRWLCATVARYLDSIGRKWSSGSVDLWCPEHVKIARKAQKARK